MGKRFYLNFQIIWISIIIPLLSYIFFKKTLNLALYGDDWEQLYNLWLSFDVSKTLSFFDIKSYLGPYTPQYLFLGIIKHFFEYQPTPYFAFSLLFRILATISLFFLVKKLTDRSLPAYLSSLIFTFSAAGLQTTDWVFNMNTYVGVFFLNFSVILYLKMRNPKKLFFLIYLLFIIFFTLALGIVPVRMHGSIIFLGAIEFFLIFFSNREKKFKIDRYFFLRVLTPIIIFLVLLKLGSFGNPGENISLKSSTTYLGETIQKGRIDVLFYFLGIVGNFVFPDTVINTAALGRITFMSLYFVIADFLLTIAIRGGKRMFVYLIISNIPGLFLAKALILWNPLLSPSNILSILIGIHIIIVSFILFFQFRKSNWSAVSLIVVGLIWLISFSFLYWFKTPYLIIETTSRYLTMGAFGFSILFAGLLWLMIDRAQFQKKAVTLTFFIPFFLLLFWLIINLRAANIYLTNLEKNRNINLVNKSWTVLLNNVPVLDKDSPSVFYFTTDDSTMIYMIFSFGFPPHGGLLYQIPDWLNTPIPTEHYEELFKMVSSGKILQTLHGRKPIPIPLSRVFAFDFRNGELTPTTDLVRQQLSKDLQNYQGQIITPAQ